jgi:hypothetical protein
MLSAVTICYPAYSAPGQVPLMQCDALPFAICCCHCHPAYSATSQGPMMQCSAICHLLLPLLPHIFCYQPGADDAMFCHLLFAVAICCSYFMVTVCCIASLPVCHSLNTSIFCCKLFHCLKFCAHSAFDLQCHHIGWSSLAMASNPFCCSMPVLSSTMSLAAAISSSTHTPCSRMATVVTTFTENHE